jgi:hypothetical protein
MLKASAGEIKWDGASDDRNAKGDYINGPRARTCARNKIRDDQRNGNHGAQRKENQNGHLWEGLDDAERFGSGDGERKTLLTRQMPYEPLPASVLFAFVPTVVVVGVNGGVDDIAAGNMNV